MTLLMKASVTQVAMTIILLLLLIIIMMIIMITIMIIIIMRMIMVTTLIEIRTIIITMTYSTPTLPSPQIAVAAVDDDGLSVQKVSDVI